MKPLFFTLFVLMPIVALSQKTSVKTSTKQTSSQGAASTTPPSNPSVGDLEKDVLESTQKVQQYKKAIIDSVNLVHSKGQDLPYGYLIFKSDEIKLYDKDLKPIANESLKNPDAAEQLREETNNHKVLDDKAQYRFVKIDSILVSIKKNRLTEIILFSGKTNVTYINNISSDLEALPTDTTKIIAPTGEDTTTYVRLIDLLEFVPINDDDNVKSGSYTLSSKTYKLILQNK